MATKFSWAADPSNKHPISLDPYSRWFLSHGNGFEFSADEPKEATNDFGYSAVVISCTQPPTTIPDPDGPFSDLSNFTVESGAVEKTLLYGLVENGEVPQLEAKLATFEKRFDAPDKFIESMILRVPLRERSVLPMGFEEDTTWHRPATLDGDRTVIVAAIDDGINFAHERFRLRGGTSRVDFAWVQDGTKRQTSKVEFGREWTRDQIDAELKVADGDEDALLRALELVNFSRFGVYPVARRATHGTHVLDLAAGNTPNSEDAPDLIDNRIIAVQIPSLVTLETSGALLGYFLMSGLHYILSRARSISAELNIAVPVVVNFSFAIAGGPHNGKHFIESVFDLLVRYHRDELVKRGIEGGAEAIVELVMPAGNRHLARCHAEVSPKSSGRAELKLPWKVQPGDRTPSYLELWLPKDAADVDLKITDPISDRESTVVLNEKTAQVLWDAYLPDEESRLTSVVAWVHYAKRLEGDLAYLKQRVLVTLAPTENLDADRPPAPAGLWQVALTAKIAKKQKLEAWIQRDSPPVGYRFKGRQSYFDDPDYEKFNAIADWQDEDDSSKQTQRSGSLSGIATSDSQVVIGGYRYRDGLASLYSAGASGAPMRNPDAMAVSDTSRVLGGVLAAGSRNGTRLAISGTSVAAPQVARRLAKILTDLRPNERGNFGARGKIQGIAIGYEEANPLATKKKRIKKRIGAGRLPTLKEHEFQVNREEP